MKKNDARKLSTDAQQQIRYQVIRLKKQGRTREEISKITDVHRSTCSQWWSLYRAEGRKALKIKKRGRPPGSCRTLSPEQEKELRKAIHDKCPDQMKLPFALWTREMVVSVIKKQFGVTLSVSSVGRLLRQLGFSCQKPLYRAYQQDSDAVAKWKNEVFPEIKKKAKKVGATIYFEDESGIRSDFHSGKTWAEKGSTPVVQSTGARFSLNMIAAISTRGKMRFMVIKGTVQAEEVCNFLRRLMHNAKNPIFLIWDGHPTHKSRKVRKCVESFDGQLEVFFLPPYSPELNPSE